MKLRSYCNERIACDSLKLKTSKKRDLKKTMGKTKPNNGIQCIISFHRGSTHWSSEWYCDFNSLALQKQELWLR